MLRLPEVELHANAKKQLKAWTKESVEIATFDERVSKAKSRFSSRNRKSNKTFDRVKVALDAMCPGARRCVYCEDNYADEVEHIHPKDTYPELAFAWDNYVYACGPCNGPKNNHFAVFDAAGLEHDVTPPRPAPSPRVPPVAGDPLLINPREEDPFVFLVVDLPTGTVVLKPGLPTMEARRAEYTRDVLGMNERRLPKARKDAFTGYRARLFEYVVTKEGGASGDQLAQLRDSLLDLDHPTVWAEIKRQQAMEPALADLFQRAPEALNW
jgi:uncharacterized protein (TIGR02646 family)